MAQPMPKVARKPKRVFPLPEAIPAHKGAAKQPEAWRIRESGASVPRTEIERGEMAVPLGDDAISECVRAHETGHARWSPSRPPAGLAWDVVQAVEDMRIHSLLGSSGVDLAAGLTDPVETAQAMTRLVQAPTGPDRRMLTLMRCAALGTGTAPVIDRAVATAARDNEAAIAAYQEMRDLSNQAQALMHSERKRPKFEDTRRVAEWLETMLATPEAAKKAEREEAGKRERLTAEEREEVREGRPKPGGPGPERKERSSSDHRWGTMRVERVPLTQPLPPRRGHKRVRPCDEGETPRRIERWCVDQAIFAATKRMRRGTVLIDQSGSMHMSAADVVAILDVAPAARVAGYAGDAGKGTLRVIADRGRRCADRLVNVRFGGNVIDGPALRWLARQPGPRVWVCDGGVTGVDDRPAPNLTYEAAQVCRAAGIVRVPTVDLAVKLMAEGARA